METTMFADVDFSSAVEFLKSLANELGGYIQDSYGDTVWEEDIECPTSEEDKETFFRRFQRIVGFDLDEDSTIVMVLRIIVVGFSLVARFGSPL